MPIKRTVNRASVPKTEPSEAVPMEARPAKQPNSGRISPLTIGIISVVVIAAIALGIKQTWFSGKGSEEQAESKKIAASAPNDITDLISRVSKHIMVKQGETPTVATIQDINVLQQQNAAFYKDAQNGDRLLVWSDKAVLYSPTQDIILAVLPISLPASAVGQQPTNATNTAETATIEVRNGSGITGLAKTFAQTLTAAGMDVLPAAAANKSDYAKTVIVKLTDKALPQTLKDLETATKNAAVVEMPEGEKASKADFLVIVGADLK